MIRISEGQINKAMETALRGGETTTIWTTFCGDQIGLRSWQFTQLSGRGWIWVKRDDVGHSTNARLWAWCRKHAKGVWVRIVTERHYNGRFPSTVKLDGVMVPVGMALKLNQEFCANEIAAELERKRESVYNNDQH